MRFYQDSRGFDALFFEPQDALLMGGKDGAFYALEGGDNDAGTIIPLLWISRFSDQSLPNNEKTYQDLVVEHNTGGTVLTVKALINNGATTVTLGTVQSTERTQTTFRISGDEGLQGLNFAALIEGDKIENPSYCELYGVFLHWYPEARKALTWDSDELDQGTQKVKAYRAIELDLKNLGAVTVQVYTDMPGNNMALRLSKTVPASTTRRAYQVPLGRPYIEGRRVRVIVKSADGVTEFQLYGGRIEAQVFGEYVEGYESAAGREWDSGTLDLGSPRVKEIREAQLDVDSDGALTFDLHTELPGLSMVSRTTKTVNTETTTAGRRMVNLPLLADGATIDGKLLRMFLRGTSAWRLYGAWLFCRPVGYYVEAYQAATGHIWDSTVLDLGTQQVKRLLQVYFEAHADSPLTVKVYTSNANGEMTLRDTQTLAASAGRKPYIVPLEAVYGRLVRVTISSTGAFRLFHVRALVKPIGVYLNGGTAEVFPVEAEQDLNSERVKLFKELEVVYQGGGALEFSSDPSGAVESIKTFSLATSALTRTAKLRLPNRSKGRLIRALITPGTGDLQVFALRIWARTVGESGQVAWGWITLPIPATPDNYGWADIYVAPTPPAYEWVPVYVAPTQTEKWDWAELPVKL
jgi:hypothetical protein